MFFFRSWGHTSAFNFKKQSFIFFLLKLVITYQTFCCSTVKTMYVTISC